MRHHRLGQLDALRAFAVFGVVACHTFDVDRHPWIDYGGQGVQLFFVISGFLITGILIDARRDATASQQPMKGVVRSFYARRALRIFPVYYVTLLVGAAIGVQGMRENLGWNLLYLSNWKTAIDGEWGAVTHIWSLAVEEQFYLVWPLVVLFAPKRLLPWAIGSMVAIALMTRAILATTDTWGVDIMTPAVFDALGLGALLALVWRISANVDRIVTWIGALAVFVFALDVATAHVSWMPDISPMTHVWWPLLFTWLVHHVARGVRGPAVHVLTWRPLVYAGTISYGIYLFHLFVVPVSEIVERNFGVNVPIPGDGVGRFVAVSVVSIAVASLSWTVLERPINEQKHRFPYVRTDAAGGPQRIQQLGAPVPLNAHTKS